MADKHMNRCSTALGTREMQIKTIMKYHYIHSNMAKMKKIKTNVEQEPVHC